MARTGRPRFQPTDEMRARVRALASTDATQDEIAQDIGISTNTLTLYFREDLAAGKTKGDLKIRVGLTRAATGWMDENRPPDANEIRALLKLAAWRLGYTETTKHEHTGSIVMEDAEIARELAELRRKRAAARAGDLEAGLSEEPDGLVH